MQGSAREEAERLIATVLARAAKGGLGGASSDPSGTSEHLDAGLGALGEALAGVVTRLANPSTAQRPASGWSTGGPECCVCPVCRAIAAVRDPSPESAARLATGAGDLAAGVASMLRAVSALAGEPPRPDRQHAAAPSPSPDEAWSTATRTTGRTAGEPVGRPTPDQRSTSPAPDERSTGPAPDQGSTGSLPDQPPGGSAPDSTAGASALAGATIGVDPWAAASAASAAAVAAERAAAQGARRAAAMAAREAAAEAARRVAAAAAAAGAAKAAAAEPIPAAGSIPASGEEAASKPAPESGGEPARPRVRAMKRAPVGKPVPAARGATTIGRDSVAPGDSAAVAGSAPVGGTASRGDSGGGPDAGVGGAHSSRTARRVDVWAAATADAGVVTAPEAVTVDHDVPGAAAPRERDGAAGDAAPGGGAA